MYQKCPVCDGTGLVSRPPWIAGDQSYWIGSSSGPYTCKACGGSCVIWYNEKLLDPCGLFDLPDIEIESSVKLFIETGL